MKVHRVFALLFLYDILTGGCCTILAMKGYVASNPGVRNFLIQSGFGTLISRKAERLYEASNFRHISDQGTTVRKSQMKTHDIVEVNPNGENEESLDFKENPNRSGLLHAHEYKGDEDRLYSEKVFGVLNEMDKNGCVSRLLCEIGADPKPFGDMGMRINNYIKSVPPVTWNSATFPYLEAFQAGLNSSKDTCAQHYLSCTSNLKKIMKLLWFFLSPIKSQLTKRS